MPTRIVAAAIGLAALTAAPAYAQQLPCAPTAQMVERLGKSFGEHLAAAGLGADGRIIGFYANVEKQTFTVVKSDPNGVSCVIDSGEAFAVEAPVVTVPKGEAS